MIVLRSALKQRESWENGMGRKETPYADRSGRSVTPDRIARTWVHWVTRSFDSLASRTNTLQQTHTSLNTIPTTPFISVGNHPVFTRGPARPNRQRYYSLQRCRSQTVSFSNSLHLNDLGSGPHCLFPRLSSVTPRDSTWASLRAHSWPPFHLVWTTANCKDVY